MDLLDNIYVILYYMNKDISLVPFQRGFFEDESKMDDFVQNCDVIVHLAGLNRSNDEEVIFNANISLTKDFNFFIKQN